ncbi:pleckstrin homology domain-containing family F member 2-like [Eucyclogobius newberryi]|uniref:pleckstrin homology domain-containing family F member 2-like n=1 Tax=Eucyclogobius newberryi TaxID=166745 RepID=UPI003B594127
MGDTLLFPNDNQRRIYAVQKSFGPFGARLLDPSRTLIGEGRLMKQSRRGPQPKVFFLFNDMLVYGSIVISGRLFKSQKIIPLGDIKVEDLENGYMRNQWLIQTPEKSFYVSAASREEKLAWIEHIEVCKTRLPSSDRPVALTLIPDQASAICMRCCRKFTAAHRRHHCRKCGFLVCGVCSRKRALIGYIHPTKRQRVCGKCHNGLSERDEEDGRERRDSTGLRSDEDEQANFDDHFYEEYVEDYEPEDNDSGMDSFSPYVYLKPEHIWPSV